MKKLFITLGIIVVLVIAWILLSPLFINNVVEEDFPFEELVEETAEMDMDGEAIPSAEQLEQMSEPARMAIADEVMERSANLPDQVMNEPMPIPVIEEEAEPVVPVKLSSGQFVDADSFHMASGSASIYQNVDGTSLLRLEDFRVTNGPDLRVLLVDGPVVNPERAVRDSNYVELGKLKGNVGNQNYEIDSSIDLSQYSTVVIYCKPFHVTFGEAVLSAEHN